MRANPVSSPFESDVEKLRARIRELELENARLLQLEQTSHINEERYRALFEQSHDAVFILSLDGIHLDANRRASELLGYTHEELLSLSVADTSVEQAQSKDVIKRLLKGEHIPLYERRFRRKNGKIIFTEINVEIVRDASGNPLYIQSVVRDITERKYAEIDLAAANEQMRMQVREIMQLQSELREQALRDPLTGLYNRRYLNETLERELARVEREQKPLSIIMFDIDHFKNVNDTHGHIMGDQFLMEIASLLKKHIRVSDIACRYGGEEFLLVMPGITAKAALARAEEIRRQCEALNLCRENIEIGITISMGVAEYPTHEKDARGLIEKADRSMYASKAKGRNQITVWNENL